jgi:hypothetical protein
MGRHRGPGKRGGKKAQKVLGSRSIQRPPNSRPRGKKSQRPRQKQRPKNSRRRRTKAQGFRQKLRLKNSRRRKNRASEWVTITNPRQPSPRTRETRETKRYGPDGRWDMKRASRGALGYEEGPSSFTNTESGGWAITVKSPSNYKIPPCGRRGRSISISISICNDESTDGQYEQYDEQNGGQYDDSQYKDSQYDEYQYDDSQAYIDKDEEHCMGEHCMVLNSSEYIK